MSDTKFCTHCGTPLFELMKFCPGCGTPIQIANIHTNEEHKETISEAITKAKANPGGAGELDFEQPQSQTEFISHSASDETAKPKGKVLHTPDNSRKKLLLWGGVGVAILVIFIVAISTLTNPLHRFESSISRDNYAEAISIYQEDIQGSAQDEYKALETVENRIEDVRNRYMKGSLSYETAIASLNAIERLGMAYDRLLVAHEDIETMNQSRTAFSTGQRLFEMQDYAGGISAFRSVILEDENYETAQAQLAAAAGALRSSAIDEAKTLMADNKYSQAILVLESALLDIPDDSKIQEELGACRSAFKTYRKQDILASTKDLIAKNDYSAAFQVLENGLLEFPDDGELKNALSEYQNTFVSQALSEAEQLFQSSGYEAAIGRIVEAKAVLNDNVQLLEKQAYYESYLSVDLFSFTPFTGSSSISSARNQKDIYGKQHPQGYYVGATFVGSIFDSFELEGKYSKLYGSIVLIEYLKNTSSQYWMEFYDGGHLIGKSEVLTGGSKIESFSFNISGVTDLKVVFMSSNRGWGFIVPEICIQK